VKQGDREHKTVTQYRLNNMGWLA